MTPHLAAPFTILLPGGVTRSGVMYPRFVRIDQAQARAWLVKASSVGITSAVP